MAPARSSCKDLLERILPGSPQGLLSRTCTESYKDLLERIPRISTRSSQKDLCKIMQGLLETLCRTSAGSAQDLLTSTSTRSCADRLTDGISFTKIFKTSPHEDLYKTLVKILMYCGLPRLHHETRARSRRDDLTRTTMNRMFKFHTHMVPISS